MKSQVHIQSVPVALLCFIFIGCSTPVLRKEVTKSVMAGVYDIGQCRDSKKDEGYECYNAKIKMFIAHSTEIKDGQTTLNDLKKIGFDPKAENVVLFPGSQGRKYILGTENVQIQLSYPKQMGEYLEEDDRYLTVVYPLLNTKNTTDRVYFSKKVADKTGSDLNFVVILYNSVVKKSFYIGVENLNEKQVENAFGEGALNILMGLRSYVNFP